LSGAVPICRLPYAVDSLPYAREFGLIRDQDDQRANSAAGSDTTIAIFSLIGRTFGRNKIPRLALIVLQVGFVQLEVAQRLARWHPHGPLGASCARTMSSRMSPSPRTRRSWQPARVDPQPAAHDPEMTFDECQTSRLWNLRKRLRYADARRFVTTPREGGALHGTSLCGRRSATTGATTLPRSRRWTP
jgi:hypothetical protein